MMVRRVKDVKFAVTPSAVSRNTHTAIGVGDIPLDTINR